MDKCIYYFDGNRFTKTQTKAGVRISATCDKITMCKQIFQTFRMIPPTITFFDLSWNDVSMNIYDINKQITTHFVQYRLKDPKLNFTYDLYDISGVPMTALKSFFTTNNIQFRQSTLTIAQIDFIRQTFYNKNDDHLMNDMTENAKVL